MLRNLARKAGFLGREEEFQAHRELSKLLVFGGLNDLNVPNSQKTKRRVADLSAHTVGLSWDSSALA